jgi:hypothetical protein
MVLPVDPLIDELSNLSATCPCIEFLFGAVITDNGRECPITLRQGHQVFLAVGDGDPVTTRRWSPRPYVYASPSLGLDIRFFRDSGASVMQEHAFAGGWPRAANGWRRAKSWPSTP